jgi:hypothetical protein
VVVTAVVEAVVVAVAVATNADNEASLPSPWLAETRRWSAISRS